MKHHLKQFKMIRSGEPSQLVLRKLKGSTTYSVIRSPVTAKSHAISINNLEHKDTHGLLGLSLPHDNTFITNFHVKKTLVSRDTLSSTGRAAAQLKGISSVVQRYQNTYHLYPSESQVYQCDFFRLMYYPPDHFLAMFRKSKPAINIRTIGQVFLNGNVPNIGQEYAKTVFQENSKKYGFSKVQDIYKKLNDLFQNNPCSIPSNYAFLRRQLRITLKKCFISEWCKRNGDRAVQESISSEIIDGSGNVTWKYLDKQNRTLPGVAKDGYYSFQVLVFPDKHTKGEFEANIRKSVQVVANLEWDKFLKCLKPAKGDKNKTWVQLANSRVRPESLNKLLKNSEIPYSVNE